MMGKFAVCLAALLLTRGASLAQSPVERGRYLAVLGDCAGCHTAPGGQPFAGGLALQQIGGGRLRIRIVRRKRGRPSKPTDSRENSP